MSNKTYQLARVFTLVGATLVSGFVGILFLLFSRDALLDGYNEYPYTLGWRAAVILLDILALSAVLALPILAIKQSQGHATRRNFALMLLAVVGILLATSFIMFFLRINLFRLKDL